MYLKAKISLLVVTVLWMTSQYTYVPILSSYANQLGASAFLIGMIGGATGVVSLCSRIPLSILSDKWNRKKVFIIFGMAVCFLAALVPSLIHYPESFALGAGFNRVGHGHFRSLYRFICQLLSKRENRFLPLGSSMPAVPAGNC